MHEQELREYREAVAAYAATLAACEPRWSAYVASVNAASQTSTPL